MLLEISLLEAARVGTSSDEAGSTSPSSGRQEERRIKLVLRARSCLLFKVLSLMSI